MWKIKKFKELNTHCDLETNQNFLCTILAHENPQSNEVNKYSNLEGEHVMWPWPWTLPVCPHDAPAYNTAQPGEMAEWGGRRAGGIQLFINIITFITTTQGRGEYSYLSTLSHLSLPRKGGGNTVIYQHYHIYHYHARAGGIQLFINIITFITTTQGRGEYSYLSTLSHLSLPRKLDVHWFIFSKRRFLAE